MAEYPYAHARSVVVDWRKATTRFVAFHPAPGEEPPHLPVTSRDTHLEGRALVQAILDRKTGE
jgi:hypothetical protein